jgi:hypothetical protein
MSFAKAPPINTLSANKIKLIFEQKIEHLQNNKNEFEKILPELLKNAGKIATPKFQIFEGKEGLQNALKDALLYNNLETATYWPIKSMIGILGGDFFRYLNKERIKKNIYNRAIWPEKQKVSIEKHPYLGYGDDFLREIRIAPKDINFEMGYWIYNNKAVFISSRKESFGFIIESKEFTEMLLSQSEVIWKISKPIVTKPINANSFLKEI